MAEMLKINSFPTDHVRNKQILAKFYSRSGLTEKWLQQQANERTWAPSKARIDRARWMAKKLTGGSLRTRKGKWAIVPNGSSRSEVDTAFAQEKGVTFNAIESTLFGSFEQRKIPHWLASHYRTWRAINALKELHHDS
jgi:hypothetical protein